MTLNANPTELTGESGSAMRANKRRARVLGAALAVTAAAYLYSGMNLSAPSFEHWEISFEAAQDKARVADRNMLLAFYMHGCPPCAIMDRSVLNTSAVKQALQSYVPARLDALSEPAAGRYGVYATPTFIIADPAGKALARCEGYQSVEEFTAFLQQALPKTQP
ncbi:MAG: thioredoxin family protein [Phycisphaerae bacterium]